MTAETGTAARPVLASHRDAIRDRGTAAYTRATRAQQQLADAQARSADPMTVIEFVRALYAAQTVVRFWERLDVAAHATDDLDELRRVFVSDLVDEITNISSATESLTDHRAALHALAGAASRAEHILWGS